MVGWVLGMFGGLVRMGIEDMILRRSFEEFGWLLLLVFLINVVLGEGFEVLGR